MARKKASYYLKKSNKYWDLYGKYKKEAKRARKAAQKAETTYHRIRLTGK